MALRDGVDDDYARAGVALIVRFLFQFDGVYNALAKK